MAATSNTSEKILSLRPELPFPSSKESSHNASSNTIVVLTAGGNVDMTQWIDNVPAILRAWYPGQEGGTALAQLIFGDYSPSGKLPASFERRWEDNPAFHSYYPGKGE